MPALIPTCISGAGVHRPTPTLSGSRRNTSTTSSNGHGSNFEPAGQAHSILSQERLHAGATTERLIDALLVAEEQGRDPMSMPLEGSDRQLLASVLMDEREELTPELLEEAIRSLRRRVLRRQ